MFKVGDVVFYRNDPKSRFEIVNIYGDKTVCVDYKEGKFILSGWIDPGYFTLVETPAEKLIKEWMNE